jgi:hypothetical protein
LNVRRIARGVICFFNSIASVISRKGRSRQLADRNPPTSLGNSSSESRIAAAREDGTVECAQVLGPDR